MEFIEAYNQILNFLESIGVDKSIMSSVLDLNRIEGMILKKLSSSNMAANNKKNITIKGDEEDNKSGKQTHLDFPRDDLIDFLFSEEERKECEENKLLKNINVKLFSNNLEYLKFLDSSRQGERFTRGEKAYIPIERNDSNESDYHFSNTEIYDCEAEKTIGHLNPRQAQINTENKKGLFSEMRHKMFVNDVLIIFKLNYGSYISVTIPNIPKTQNYMEYFKFNKNKVNILLLNNGYIEDNLEREMNEIEDLETNLEKQGLEGKDVERVVKARVGQGNFRKLLIDKYKNGCCICGMKNLDLLRASHIKAWRESNPQEKLDKNNGLLLCANHDALFDNHLISFTDLGEILLSNYLDEDDKKLLGIDSTTRIIVDEEMTKYLEHHRKEFNKENQAKS